MEHFYTPEELGDLDKEALETITEARGLEVAGSGSGGNVVKDDLIEAITTAQDRTGINPALVAEPEPDVERTYKVSGTHEVYGHAPGQTFTKAIPADQEALLLESGAISASPQNQKEGE